MRRFWGRIILMYTFYIRFCFPWIPGLAFEYIWIYTERRNRNRQLAYQHTMPIWVLFDRNFVCCDWCIYSSRGIAYSFPVLDWSHISLTMQVIQTFNFSTISVLSVDYYDHLTITYSWMRREMPSAPKKEIKRPIARFGSEGCNAGNPADLKSLLAQCVGYESSNRTQANAWSWINWMFEISFEMLK